MTRTLPRAAAVLGLAALLTAGLAMPAGAASGTTVYVVAADLSGTNVSAASTKWDSPTGSAAATLPAAGTKWALDIENKPAGIGTVTADGLVLTVATVPAPQKVRYQYYVGTGGYPTIDSQHPTLNMLLDSALTWDLTLTSGTRTTYGPVFQVQLQKPLPGANGYARVTVQTVWSPTDGTHDLQNGLWFSNTNIYAGGYPVGATTYAPTGGAVLNTAGSGPGVSAAVLEDNFGDFEVVSFGPNLGRDYPYAFAFQNVTALGHTFVFVTQLPAAPTNPPTAPVTSGTTTTPATRTGTGAGAGQLETFALPEATPTPTPTPTPSPSASDEPSEEPTAPDETVAEPTTNVDEFPAWILILGIGFLVLVLAFILWIVRRRTV